jgi:hypothetical protein
MFKWKTIIIFALAVGVSCGAASYRFGDSAHAIGMLSNKGGKARHGFMIKSGKEGYTLVMTGVVLPPYKGDVNIALEGSPAMRYSIYDSKPIVDLGIHRRPKLEGSLLSGVESGDKLALWVVMTPESDQDLEGLFEENAAAAPDPSTASELLSDANHEGDLPLKLSFYAADSGKSLLQIPVVFADLQADGGSNGAHH